MSEIEIQELFKIEDYNNILSKISQLNKSDLYSVIRIKNLLDICKKDNANELVEYLSQMKMFQNISMKGFKPLKDAISNNCINNIRSFVNHGMKYSYEDLFIAIDSINSIEIFRLLAVNKAYLDLDLLGIPFYNEKYEIIDVILEHFPRNDSMIIVYGIFACQNSNVLQYLLYHKNIRLNLDKLTIGRFDYFIEYSKINIEAENIMNNFNYLKDNDENFNEFMLINEDIIKNSMVYNDDYRNSIYKFYETNF